MTPNRIFFNFEYIEGFKHGRHFIQMISIGMVKDSGETYLAVSSEFDSAEADSWVMQHVISPLFDRFKHLVTGYTEIGDFHKTFGKPQQQIANEIKNFVGTDPIFYGSNCDYDWVLLCSLYGNRTSIPDTWPIYARDIQQMVDGLSINKEKLLEEVPQPSLHDAISQAKWTKDAYAYIKNKITK